MGPPDAGQDLDRRSVRGGQRRETRGLASQEPPGVAGSKGASDGSCPLLEVGRARLDGRACSKAQIVRP